MEKLVEGLKWPESPRWRNGELWFSDVHNFRVMRLDAHGVVHAVCDVPGRPGGLGFMPDGRILLATALARELLWIDPATGTATLAADLKSMTRSLLNDLVVDAKGRAWVGDTGFIFGSSEPERPGTLIRFDRERGAQIVADDLRFPNGIAITPDGRTLYIAETFGNRISAFDVDESGTLSNRRVHVELESAPDGLALDAEGALWVPLLFKSEFQRITQDGQIVERIALPGERAISCVLGGADRKTLFLGTAFLDDTDKNAIIRKGSIYARSVQVPGAGVP